MEVEDSAELGRGRLDASASVSRARRRARRSSEWARDDGRNPSGETIVTLSWWESACATTTGVMGLRVARGAMTGRAMSLCVLGMWTVSLAYKAVFIGLRMDQNTPPPDRVALLAIKLFFSALRWAVVTAVRAPVWTCGALYAGVTRRAVDVGWDDEIAARDGGPKDLAEDVRDAVTTKDYESFAEAVANDEGEWDVIATGRAGCCTYRMLRGVSAEDKRMMKRGLAKFRTEVLAEGVPVEVLFDAQTDLLGRQQWDETTLHPTCVAHEDPSGKDFTAQDVVYWRLKYPRLMAPRDYTVARRMWRDKANDTATCICRDALGAPSAVAAKTKLQRMMGSRGVDVKSLYSAIMVGRNDEVRGSQYVSIYYEDPGVPPRLAHMAAAKGLDGYMSTFQQELQRRVRENARMKGYDAIPEPPTTREIPHSRSFTTGRTSVPQSDEESESRAGSPPLESGGANLHFAPTDASREYRFSGRDGLNKRQRIRRRVSKFLKLLSELVDPNAASLPSRRAEESTEDEREDAVGDPPPGRKRKWLRRVALGVVVALGRFSE
jgi:hypothetical protein